VADVEIFDPRRETFELVPDPGLAPRALHTATLVTDGRVLLAGGIGDGGVLEPSVETWSPQDRVSERIDVSMAQPRRGHTATLLPDGIVWLAGGTDGAGRTVTADETFDPRTDTINVTPHAPALPGPTDAPRITASIPADDEVDVPLGAIIAVRFSKPIRMESATSHTVTLTGIAGVESASIVPAEGGRLVFVTPDVDLLTGARYTVALDGLIDVDGVHLPRAIVRFTTRLPETEVHARPGTGPFGRHTGHHGGGQYDVTPPGQPAELDEWQWRGEQRDGKPYSPWQSLPPLRAAAGVTALSGQVLRLNGQPLEDVTLQIGNRTTRTDRSGRFLLVGPPAGTQVLVMDGSTANRPRRSYGLFDYLVTLADTQTTILPFTIWMPLLDTQNATAIPVPTPTEFVATSPRIKNLEVHIPAGVVLQTAAGPLRWMALTEIPVDRPPYPLPEGTRFFFTPQSHGALVVRPDGSRSPEGVRFILPNRAGLAPGMRVHLPMYDTEKDGWYILGRGRVARDGARVIPDPDAQIFRFACVNTLGSASNAPAETPVIPSANRGDPVDVATGLFVYEKTDLAIPDVIPIIITRKYRPLDSIARPFGVGGSLDYQAFLIGDATTFTYAELVLGDGGRIHYDRISAGTGQADAVMEHTGTPTRFFKSRLSYDSSRSGWQIAFLDGTIYRFSSYGFPGPLLNEIQDRWSNRLVIARTGGLHPNLRIARITSPNGRWVDFTYDSSDRVVQLRDNSGRTVTYTYTTPVPGRVASVTDPAGGVTQYTYDASARMATITDPRSITFLTNQYDAASRVSGQTQADGTTFQFAYTLDVNGKIIQTDVTDPRGNVERFTFDAAGHVLTDTRAHGTSIAQTTTYTRNATSHAVQSATDGLGRQTTFTYDSFGNVTSVMRLAGTVDAVTTTFTYESTFQQVASVTDPLSHTTTLAYDGSGNLTSSTNALGQATTFTYNASGQPLTVTTPAGTTTLTYDTGDVATITDPMGNTTARFTDALGRRAATTTPLGQRTRSVYDALNRVTQVTDALAGLTQVSYDANGNPTGLTDARGSVTAYAYNSMDRVITRTDPLTRTETYVYDNNGNVTTVVDRKSQTTTSTYDALDRLTQRTFQDGSTTSYTWDAGNRLTQAVDSLSGTITRTYDGLDRLLTEATPNGTLAYTYDAAGRRATMAVPGQATISYAYDNADRLTSITQGSNVVAFDYDNADRRTRVTLPNGVTTDYAYDTGSRLTGLTYKLGSTTLGTLSYGYDAAGRRIVLGGTWARTLVPSALASATYDSANQQTTFGGQTLTYDLNGNLTSDAANTYTWNARNQLTAISGPTPASFVYDALGRRQRKTLAATVTDFLYDGLNPVRETVGATTIDLLTGFGIDEYPMRTTATTAEQFLTDALGSTVALTDAGGAVQTQYTYEPFGAATVTGGSTNEFGYTGREDDATQLVYYRARYYHPALQRFISQDPIGFAGGGFNLYAYVDNNPVQYTDPLGYTKGGQQNINVTHDGKVLTKRTPIQEVQRALEEAIDRGMSRAHIAKLRGLLKVIARGGAAGIIGFILGELLYPPEAGAGSECPHGPRTCVLSDDLSPLSSRLPPSLSGRKDAY
jgi:RHS repeat-associated protein